MFQEWKKIVSKPLKVLDIFISAIVIGLTLFLIFYWKHIPKQVPLHWNSAGQIDRYADASGYVLLLLMMYFFLAFHQITKLFPLFDIKENLFGKEKANLVTKEIEREAFCILYDLLWSIDLLCQCIFTYIILCGIFVQNLGAWLLPTVFVFLVADFIWFFVKIEKLKRQVDTDE